MRYLGKMLSILALISLLFVARGSAADVARKVAVLPFQINGPEDLSYMREGIMDMLSSRLSWEGKVAVVQKQIVKEALAGFDKPLTEAAVREVGANVQADYVLFGSLTVFGESVSIDAKMVALKEEKPPVTVYAQTKGMSEVIPRIHEFAQDINTKIFGRGGPALAAETEQPRFSQAHPEKLLGPGGTPQQPELPTGAPSPPDQGGQQTSELNPYFVVPSTVAQGGFWKSQRLELAITSMAVADVNQDGRVEILLLSPGELRIYQQAANSLHLVKSYRGGSDDHFLWVSAADLNQNQIPEIYVSNRRREKLMSSFVLEWRGSDWEKTAEQIRWHLRATSLPDQGTVLVGQAGRENEPFAGSVFVMKVVEKEWQPFSPLPLPTGVRIYSFSLADLTQDGTSEVLLVEESGRITVRGENGDRLWQSSDRYAASFDYLEGAERDPAASQFNFSPRTKVYLSAPILTPDLDQDGRAEMIVNKNIAGIFGRGIVERNFFGKSELYSFSWNGLAMVANWHTPEYEGMTTAYEVADVNGDGHAELWVALVNDPGTAFWKDAKSRVVAYPIASK